MRRVGPKGSLLGSPPGSTRHDSERYSVGMARKLAPFVLALALTGCGGAAVYVGDNGGVAFSVNGFLDGRTFGNPARAGETTSVTIDVGQAIEFDADGAVSWRFSLNGAPSLPAGSTASTGGLAVTVSPVGGSRVRVTTTLSGPAPLPATVSLTATSDVDKRVAATVQLRVR